MSDELNVIFGIDLGTTYSCIAYVDQTNRAVVEPNAENERVTPSVVYFKGGGEMVVGKVAKEHAELFPERVAMLFKPQMGDPNWALTIEGKAYRPQDLSSYVLKKVVEDARKHTKKEIKDVVITCPAWFGEDQRNATREAGTIAGLNVRKVLNEPTAAAIAYGMESAKDETVLVYDLGGGTFDITMIDIKDNEIRVICTGGDHTLGGRKWDERIVDYLVHEACAESGDAAEMRKDRELMQELYLRVERAKQTLGRVESTTIPFNTCSGRARVELTRAKFDELTSDLLESTINLTHEMLTRATEKRKASGKDPERGFHKILMVGGSTKMPQVEARLRQEFNIPCEAYDQDEAVARGAAIYGQKLAIDDAIKYVEEEIVKKANEETPPGPGSAAPGETPATTVPTPEQTKEAERKVRERYSLPGTRGPIIKDVASHTYGVVVLNSDGNLVSLNLIMRNTELPYSHAHECGLAEKGQRLVELKVVENDSDEEISALDESKEVVRGELNLPAGLPLETAVPVTFTLNADGQLEATAKEEKSGSTIQVHAKVAGAMTAEQLEEAKSRNAGLRIVPG